MTTKTNATKLLQALRTCPKKGVTTADLVAKTGIAVPIINTTMNAYIVAGLASVELEPKEAGLRGRRAHRYFAVSA